MPLIPWQFVIYTTETDYAIKQQDLKGSIRQRSPQIYLASGELGSFKMFLEAFLLIPLNHLPLIVETGVWDETLDQMVEGEDASKAIFLVYSDCYWVTSFCTPSDIPVFGALLFSAATRPALGTLRRSDEIKVTEVKI